MDTNPLRKFLSFLGILLVIGAAYLNLVGILEANTSNDREKVLSYVISANIINGFAVLALIILTINSPKLSSLFKVFVILFLLGGLIAELYFIGTELYSKNYINYIILITNLLIRAYYLVYYFNDSWAMVIERPVAITKIIEKTIVPTEGAKVNEISNQEAENFKNQWRSIFRQARAKVGKDNFDDLSMNNAWDEVINPAVKAGDYSLDRLKDAADYLRDKAGNKITDLVFGGKRRR
jgi:hypothetical protein